MQLFEFVTCLNYDAIMKHVYKEPAVASFVGDNHALVFLEWCFYILSKPFINHFLLV